MLSVWRTIKFNYIIKDIYNNMNHYVNGGNYSSG